MMEASSEEAAMFTIWYEFIQINFVKNVLASNGDLNKI